MIKIPEHIENLWPYKAGKPISELAREKGLSHIVKLASNENPNGPSPLALLAIQRALPQSHLYVDPNAYELVQAISQEFKVAPERIVCGHGTDALLEYIIMAFSEDDDEVLTSMGTFIGAYVNTNKLGRRLVRTELKDYHFDLEAILAAITDRTRIIYLANPNNPTGSMITKERLGWFLAQVPKEILVILDEAYFQYAEGYPEYPDGIRYELPNLIVTRTLSKAYGLGGLRVGFAVGPEDLITALSKVKLPFEPNHLAQVAGAAALKDYEFLKLTMEMNRRSLTRFKEAFTELGIKYVPTYCNSLLLVFESEGVAEKFFNECLERGLIVRHVKSFGIPEGVRINSGNDEETEFAIAVIKEVAAALDKSSSGLNQGGEKSENQENSDEAYIIPQQK